MIPILLGALLLPQLPPQNLPSGGNFVGAPISLWVTGDTLAAHNLSGPQSAGLLKDQPGLLQNTLPDPHPAPSQGVLGFGPPAPFAQTNLVIDAFSTNVHWISVHDETGVGSATVAGGDGWAGVVFTLSSAYDPNNAADVYQYMFGDSQGLHPDFRGSAHRILDAPEISLPQGQPEITALDPYIPMLLEGNELLNEFFAVVFSVSADSSGNVPTSWLELDGAPGNSVGASGALVFIARWSATEGWQTPKVFKTAAQLGLAPTDDVLALAWDSRHSRLLFSSNQANSDPFMFLPPAGGTPVALKIIRSGAAITLSQDLQLPPVSGPGGPYVAVSSSLAGVDPRVPGLTKAIGTMQEENGPPTVPAHIGLYGLSGGVHVSLLTAMVATPPPGVAGAILEFSVGKAPAAQVPVDPGNIIPIVGLAYDGLSAIDYTWTDSAGLPGWIADARWRIVDGAGALIDTTPWCRTDL